MGRRKKNTKMLKQRREFFVSVGFTVIGAAIAFEHVYVACLFWAVALFYSVQWVGHSEFLHSRRSLRVALNIIVPLLAVVIGWRPVIEKRHEQLAVKMTGTLVGPRGNPNDPVSFREGNNGPILKWGGPPDIPQMKLPEGANFFLRRKADGRLLLDLDVMDRFGTTLIHIDNNVWTVAPLPWVLDKNYTDDALEVKDRRGQIVLQVRFYRDWVSLSGEWWDEYGSGVRILSVPYKEGEGGYMMMLTPLYHPDEPHIEPLLKYPSSEHWAEWRKFD